MAKLTVKNVGPIREAEIEVKKHTVFIGPQGSGKSTLAKLIAIGCDSKLSDSSGRNLDSLLAKFALESFVDINNASFDIESIYYKLLYDGSFHFFVTNEGQEILNAYKSLFSEQNLVYDEVMPLDEFRKEILKNPSGTYYGDEQAHSLNFYQQVLPTLVEPYSLLIPTERHIFPILSDSIWSLVNADINLPQSIKSFGREFERARTKQNQLQISFLGIRYSHENGRDIIYSSDQDSVPLSQSASGYQSIVPLLLVVEHQRQQSSRRFIIEEPELNLYPTAQKGLIYNLMSGLDPAVDYKDAEWVITTHSPYVLSSFNTLILAYKVVQKSEELRAEVEKIIPSRCWINPDEFAAYYVDNGTVRSIISEKTGMISDNELDDVSEDFAGEQDQLLNLYRSIPSA